MDTNYTFPILKDNLSTIALTHNQLLHTLLTQHLILYLSFVQEWVINKNMQLVHVPTFD